MTVKPDTITGPLSLAPREREWEGGEGRRVREWEGREGRGTGRVVERKKRLELWEWLTGELSSSGATMIMMKGKEKERDNKAENLHFINSYSENILQYKEN